MKFLLGHTTLLTAVITVTACTATAQPRLEIQPNGAIEVPQVVGSSKSTEAVNRRLEQLALSWACESGDDATFKVTEHTLNEDGNYVSLRYEAMQLCAGMARPVSMTGAVTLRLDDGKDITLAELIPCLDPAEIAARVFNKRAAAPTEPNCPAPEFSGHFFLRGDQIIFVEFFPQHYNDPCEFEVPMTLASFGCF